MFLEELLLLGQHPQELRAKERSLCDAVHSSWGERGLDRAVDGPRRVALRDVGQGAEVDRAGHVGMGAVALRTL